MPVVPSSVKEKKKRQKSNRIVAPLAARTPQFIVREIDKSRRTIFSLEQHLWVCVRTCVWCLCTGMRVHLVFIAQRERSDRTQIAIIATDEIRRRIRMDGIRSDLIRTSASYASLRRLRYTTTFANAREAREVSKSRARSSTPLVLSRGYYCSRIWAVRSLSLYGGQVQGSIAPAVVGRAGWFLAVPPRIKANAAMTAAAR